MKTGFYIAMPLLIGVTVSVASSSQAARITGNIQFNGVQNITFNRTQLDFSPVGRAFGDLNIQNATDDFATVTAGFIKDVTLSSTPLPNDVNVGPLSAPVTSFLSFNGSPITFDLSTVTRNLSPGAIAFVFEGTLKANGLAGKSDTPFAFAAISLAPNNFPTQTLNPTNLNQFFGTRDPGKTTTASFAGSVSGSHNKIPEPMTILGSTLALASVAILKRKKRSEQLATTRI